MKFSELIEEFVTGLIEGAPKGNEWISIDENSRRREQYRNRMDELRSEIDAALSGKAAGREET